MKYSIKNNFTCFFLYFSCGSWGIFSCACGSCCILFPNIYLLILAAPDLSWGTQDLLVVALGLLAVTCGIQLPDRGSSWGSARGAWRLSHRATRDVPTLVVWVVLLSEGVGSDSTPLSHLPGGFPMCGGGEGCQRHLLKSQTAVGREVSAVGHCQKLQTMK